MQSDFSFFTHPSSSTPTSLSFCLSTAGLKMQDLPAGQPPHPCPHPTLGPRSPRSSQACVGGWPCSWLSLCCMPAQVLDTPETTLPFSACPFALLQYPEPALPSPPLSGACPPLSSIYPEPDLPSPLPGTCPPLSSVIHSD